MAYPRNYPMPSGKQPKGKPNCATAGFVPSPSKPAAQRGDNGKGPLPKDRCATESRHVKLGGKRGS